MRILLRALLLILAVALPLGCTPMVLLEQEAAAVYAQATPTYARHSLGGRRCVVIAYTETEVAGASEAVVNLDFRQGVIVSVKQTKTAGTATTLNPKIGRAAAFTVSTQDHIATATATASHIHEQGETHFYSATSKLYVRASPDAGTDNSVSTELIVCEGAP